MWGQVTTYEHVRAPDGVDDAEETLLRKERGVG